MTEDGRMGSRALVAILLAIALIIAGTLLLPTGPVHGNVMRADMDGRVSGPGTQQDGKEE